jgi:hypothetical protein
MPIHDWTRVTAGTWHDFHIAWIVRTSNALNGGLLPASYYAQAEQIAGPMGPDVLTLQTEELAPKIETEMSNGGGLVAESELSEYVPKRRTLVIRHASGDRSIALIELVSPGNKATKFALRAFVEKAVEALIRGYHLLIVDLFPPTPREPQGIHAAIWAEFSNSCFELPPDEPLTLAAYMARPVKRAYVEPTAVGRELIDMPLFLEPEYYVNVPLEETYMAAYRGVPQRWKRVLDQGMPA